MQRVSTLELSPRSRMGIDHTPKMNSKYLIDACALTSLPGVLMKRFYHQQESLFILGHEEFQVYKKEVIKRDGISLAEVQKRQNGVSCLAA